MPHTHPTLRSLRLPIPLPTACLLLLCAGLVACSGEPKDTHPQQLVTKRKEAFKEFTRTLEPMGQVASGRRPYQRQEMLTQAQALERLSDKPWAFFTADGNYPPTRAKPEVWSQPEVFAKAQADFQARTRALTQAVLSDDEAQARAAVEAVAASCKRCHESFRNN